MISVKIQLFGALKQYAPDAPFIEVQFSSSTTSKDILHTLLEETRTLSSYQAFSELVKRSALADERHVLAPLEIVSKSCILALLPPVCGG